MFTWKHFALAVLLATPSWGYAEASTIVYPVADEQPVPPWSFKIREDTEL